MGNPLSPVVAFRGKHNLTCEVVTLYLPSDLELKPIDLGITLFGLSIKLSNKGAVCMSDNQGESQGGSACAPTQVSTGRTVLVDYKITRHNRARLRQAESSEGLWREPQPGNTWAS